VQDAEEFREFVTAGRRLADLHVGYEDVDPYPLVEQVKSRHDQDERELWRVKKMRWRSKSDRTAIIYNPQVTLTGVPDEAHRYLLGSRTALDWVIDRYQVKTDKASGIVNDPNDWCDEHGNPRYIIDLIKRVTTVSVETVKTIASLPALDLEDVSVG
jgi:predicted helicase